MKKVVKIIVLLITLVILVYAVSIVGFFGGPKAIWHDYIVETTFDPNSTEVLQARNDIKLRVVTELDFIDTSPLLTFYGVHNTDVCNEANYGFTSGILRLNDPLYECEYISQRFYGFGGDYETSVRELISFLSEAKKGFMYNGVSEVERLFTEQNWLSDPVSVKKVLSNYNFYNKDNQTSDIYEAVPLLSRVKSTQLETHSSSKDGYSARLNFFSKASPTSAWVFGGYIYNESDAPDLRDSYIEKIAENHKFGVIVEVSNSYFKKY